MTDGREAILERLLDIAQNISGVSAVRNKDEISDLARPAIVIMDGDEEGSDKDPESRPTNAPRDILLKPQIHILVSAAPESIGTQLNALRAELINAILTDSDLIQLCRDARSRQSIRYMGAELAIGRGRQAEGQLTLLFNFTYALRLGSL